MTEQENASQVRIDIFFHIFMYELETMLRGHQQEMLEISFQSDEANTDRPLKEYLKAFIMRNITGIPRNKYDNTLSIIYMDEAGQSKRNSFRYGDYADIIITDVLLPEEITDTHRRLIAESKASVYTNPDLFFIMRDGQGDTFFQSIELKSTKNDSIPGSSIQQVNPMEWVLFVKHNDRGVFITTGQYVNSINSKLQFPDRSPRPQVSFKELADWNRTNRHANQGRLEYLISHSDSVAKFQLLDDWQNYLADRWVEVLKANRIKANEPWFNNAMRKFALKFIDFYESLNPEEKANLKSRIERLTQE